MKELDPRLRAAITILPIVGLFAESVQAAQPQNDAISVPQGNMLQMERGISSMREALLAHGLDLDVEVQQDQNCNYYIKTTFVDRDGNSVCLGKSQEFGIPPNPTDSITSTLNVQKNGTLVERIQLPQSQYTDIIDRYGIQSIAVTERGFITLGVNYQAVDGYYVSGGAGLDYYAYPRNLILLPDQGVSQIKVNGYSSLTYNEVLSRYTLGVTEAVNTTYNKNYILQANSLRNPISTTWIGQEASPTSTVTSTVTVTKTGTPTPTSTVTPSATIVETRTPTQTGNISASRFEIHTPSQFRWQDGNNETAYFASRLYLSSNFVLAPNGNLAKDSTSYTDPTPLTALACYWIFALNGSQLVSYSDIYCNIPLRTGIAPADFSIGMDRDMTTLSWSSSSLPQTLAILGENGLQTVSMADGVTSYTHNTAGKPTCYGLISSSGNTEFLCGLQVSR